MVPGKSRENDTPPPRPPRPQKEKIYVFPSVKMILRNCLKQIMKCHSRLLLNLL